MHHDRTRRLAAGIALIVPVVLAAEQRPAVPADAVAACTAAYNVGANTPGTRMQRSNGSFREEMVTAPIDGCRVIIDGSMKALGKQRLPTDRLSDLLEKQGWIQLPEFSADGHDGTAFAYKRATAACVIRGEWDGGSDDDPDAPLADPYRVTVVCGNAAAVVRFQ
jgi:hypothetical protein